MNIINYITLICILSLIWGCVPVGVKTYKIKDYSVNQVYEATVGSVVMAWESGYETYSKNFAGETAKVREGLRKELIYCGQLNQVVKILYREFTTQGSRQYIRPDFSYEFQFDLSDSKEIQFRDIRISVYEITPQKIKYTITKGTAEAEDVPLSKNLVKVHLKSGQIITGEKQGFMQGEYIIVLNQDGNIEKIEWADIEKIE